MTQGHDQEYAAGILRDLSVILLLPIICNSFTNKYFWLTILIFLDNNLSPNYEKNYNVLSNPVSHFFIFLTFQDFGAKN
jgi:hypothetical protein